MRHLFIVTATVAALLATGAFLNRAGAADVGGPPPPPGYGPPYTYGPPRGYGPPPGYGPPDDYGPAPGYLADDDGPQSDYGPTLRPPRAIPYAVLPRSLAVRSACDRQ